MAKMSTDTMTGLLVTALNSRNSNFWFMMFWHFGSLFGMVIPSDVEFYVHQSLPYETMNENKADVVAFLPGKRTPLLMIEIKTDYWEPLHESQQKGGAYELTAKKHGIPLLYIIPQRYFQRVKIPAGAKILEWEKILSIARDQDNTCLADQIEHYVEVFKENAVFSKEEVALLAVPSLMKEKFQTENLIFEEIKQVLKNHGREFKFGDGALEPHDIGFSYSYDGNDLFIGFNTRRERAPFFALCIKENAGMDKYDKLYYEDGFYYIPVLGCDSMEGDKEVLTDLRKVLQEKNVVISKSFELSYRIIPRLRAKIARLYNNCFRIDSYSGERSCDGDYSLIFGGEHSIVIGIHKNLLDKGKCINLQEYDDHYLFPLCKQTRLFSDFLLSSTGDELQENFNALMNAVKKDVDKYRK